MQFSVEVHRKLYKGNTGKRQKLAVSSRTTESNPTSAGSTSTLFNLHTRAQLTTETASHGRLESFILGGGDRKD